MNWLELKLPPVIILLLLASVMWGISKAAIWAEFIIPGRELIACALSLLGLVLVIIAAITLFIAKTTLNPLVPAATTVLVTAGIYKLSRNPIYIGFLLMLLAWFVLLGNFYAVLGLPLFVVCITRLQIVPEERALLAHFGDEYMKYRMSVPRWV